MSAGIPLLLSTTQVISEGERQLEYQQFIDEVDKTILFAEQNQVSTTRQVSVPENLSIAAQHNQLVFRFYIGSWLVTTRSYEHNMTVEGPEAPGLHLLCISVEDVSIRVLFQPSRGV